MKKIIASILLLLSTNIFASKDYHAYLDLSIGAIDESSAAPEYQVYEDYTGRYTLGFHFPWVDIEWEHISQIGYSEKGRGLNFLWLTKRIEFH